jgi:hypothetical protein
MKKKGEGNRPRKKINLLQPKQRNYLKFLITP